MALFVGIMIIPSYFIFISSPIYFVLTPTGSWDRSSVLSLIDVTGDGKPASKFCCVLGIFTDIQIYTLCFSLQLLIKNKLFWLTSKGAWHNWQHKLEKWKVGQEKKDLLMWIDVPYYLLWYQTSNWVVDLFPMLWSCLSHTTVLFIITGHCAVLMIGFRFFDFFISSVLIYGFFF